MTCCHGNCYYRDYRPVPTRPIYSRQTGIVQFLSADSRHRVSHRVESAEDYGKLSDNYRESAYDYIPTDGSALESAESELELADDYRESAYDYIPTDGSALESAESELELADDYRESADDYIPTDELALELADLELESADSSNNSYADPTKISV